MAFSRSKHQAPWIDAFTDSKAALQTLSSCLALGDLNADNDYKLIISDFGNGIQVKLKVYPITKFKDPMNNLGTPAYNTRSKAVVATMLDKEVIPASEVETIVDPMGHSTQINIEDESFTESDGSSNISANTHLGSVIQGIEDLVHNPDHEVYKGTDLTVDLPLLSQPAGILSIYTDRNEPRVPGIAVATGSNLLVYRNCRPYFKFTLTPEHCLSLESEIWEAYQDSETLIKQLKELSIGIGFSNLSTVSQTLLLMDKSLREAFLKSTNHFSVKKQMVTTCAYALSKYTNNSRDVSCVLLATENSRLFIMDPETFTLLNDFTVPDIVCCLSATGIYLVEFTIIMACRNGALYCLNGGNIRFITQLDSLPVSMLLMYPKIITVNMDNTMNCFNLKGRKNWSVCLPADPYSMISIPLSGLALDLVAISLSDGNLYFYNGANLVYVITTADPISSMIFGKYGQEEHALISISQSGTLDIRLLKRTAQFNTQSKSALQGEFRPADIKLLVPKKNKLFLEQTLREMQNCKEMHAWWQHSWLGLKVLVSEAFVTAVHNFAVPQKESLKMIVKVVGLGPRMKIIISLENLSQNIIQKGLKITFLYDPKVYTIIKPIINVPMLNTGITYNFETLVNCLIPISASIQILLVSSIVLLSTVANMPNSAGILE